MAVTDDAVREVHGVRCILADGSAAKSYIRIYEEDSYIFLDGKLSERAMTPWQARYLAAKLYRLARRIRQRTETE